MPRLKAAFETDKENLRPRAADAAGCEKGMVTFMNICVCSSSKYHFPESLSDTILEFSEASLFMSALKEGICPLYMLIEPSCFSFEQLSELKRRHSSCPVAVLAPQISPEDYETICLLSPFYLISPSDLPLNDFAILSGLSTRARSIRMDSLRSGLRMALLSEAGQVQEPNGTSGNRAYHRTFSFDMRSLSIHSSSLICVCASRPFSEKQEQVIAEFVSRTPSILFYFPHQGDIVLLCNQPNRCVLTSLLNCLKEMFPELEYGIGVSDRISSSAPGDLSSCFMQAKSATEDNFYRKAEIVFYSKELFSLTQDYTTLIYYEKELTNAILMGHSEDTLLSILKEYIGYFRRRHLLPSMVCNSVYRFLNSLDRVFKFIDPLCTIDLTFITLEQINSYGTLDALHAALSNMLLDFLRRGEHYTRTPERMIHEIQAYIDDHLEQPLTLNTIEQEFYVNKFVFCRQFKKYTGMTFNQYIRTGRLLKARDLLTNTDIKIYELSARLGFQDESYFGYVFKKEFGISPTSYRLSSRNPAD